ncbi:MAG: hypothetical protein K1X35_05475 [Caulobacteraceae bacterium]|nr:hypothetical protein [Caulobacteraceae bacterium]
MSASRYFRIDLRSDDPVGPCTLLFEVRTDGSSPRSVHLYPDGRVICCEAPGVAGSLIDDDFFAVWGAFPPGERRDVGGQVVTLIEIWAAAFDELWHGQDSKAGV